MAAHNWIDLSQDADTGIETLSAHFEGHAYDPYGQDKLPDRRGQPATDQPQDLDNGVGSGQRVCRQRCEHQSQVVYLSLVFFLVSLPCLGIWALLGAGSSRVFTSPRAITRFNPCMALLLLSATWLSVIA